MWRPAGRVAEPGSFCQQMKHPFKILIWSVGAITAACLLLWVLLISSISGSSSSVVETRVLSEKELSQSMKHLNPNVRVYAGFTASQYGGWHGDGGSADVYLIEPSGTVELIAGLKRFHEEKRKDWPAHYNYDWSESSQPDLSSLEHLMPEKFRPPKGLYVIGRDRNGTHTISIERQKGYVCFASSRF